VTLAPFLPRNRRHVRQYVVRKIPRPALRRRLALRLTGRRNARCVGPTSAISLLRTRYPRIAGSLCVRRVCASAVEVSTVARQCDSLRRGARDCHVAQRDGCCLPVAMHARLASDTPVASPTDPATLARTRDSREPPRSPVDRPRERTNPNDDPGCLPSCEDLRPGDALSDTRLEPSPAPWLCHRGTGCRHLCCHWPFLRKT